MTKAHQGISSLPRKSSQGAIILREAGDSQRSRRIVSIPNFGDMNGIKFGALLDDRDNRGNKKADADEANPAEVNFSYPVQIFINPQVGGSQFVHKCDVDFDCNHI